MTERASSTSKDHSGSYMSASATDMPVIQAKPNKRYLIAVNQTCYSCTKLPLPASPLCRKTLPFLAISKLELLHFEHIKPIHDHHALDQIALKV